MRGENLSFALDKCGKPLLSWWHSLEQKDCARLRRLTEARELLLISQGAMLFDICNEFTTRRDEDHCLRIAVIVGVISQVLKNSLEHPALIFAKSHMRRTQRLLSCSEPGQLLSPMRDLLVASKRTTNIITLASNIYWWGKGSDFIRNDWAQQIQLIS